MQQYKIGTQYMTRGKCPRKCTVTDILTTYNNNGTLVKVRYVATHDFSGQTITDHDVCRTTIDRGLIQ